jgi:hypothetical protein
LTAGASKGYHYLHFPFCADTSPQLPPALLHALLTAAVAAMSFLPAGVLHVLFEKRTAAASLALLLCAAVSIANAQTIEPGSLRGVVIDDADAQFEGEWKASTHVRPYVGEGYRHDDNKDKGAKAARYAALVPENGEYHVLLSYTTGPSRATAVPITIETADGPKNVTLNEREAPPLLGFALLGQFRFEAAQDAVITVSNEGTDGHVIVDAVQIVTPDEFKMIEAEAAKKPVKVAQSPPAEKKEKPPTPPEPLPVFERKPAEGFARLTSEELDSLLAAELGEVDPAQIVRDEIFLRRTTLDIAGRQPTVGELEEFTADASPAKRAGAVDRLLASPDYGRNWGNFWSDVVGSRQQEPELTFHDYRPFKGWLGDQLNADRGWDEIVFDMMTARGKVGENPAGTFIAFHQADPKKLAGETSRVFLSVKIHCAECHDHPFIDMPTETFHGMAAFFVRTEAKIPWNESSQIELLSKEKGEHKIPGHNDEMKPIALRGMDGGVEYEIGLADLARRTSLAEWIVEPQNPFFARAYVNRIWARMMGRGFYEPVDDLGETGGTPILPEVHNALADHFIATGFDHKDLVRLIANTGAYQRTLAVSGESENDEKPLAAAYTKKLRGDEVFDSLVTAIGLPNIQPEKTKPTDAIRFPIPPKSTRDLVNEAFGYDPSVEDDLLVRNMKQAMFLMNNVQLQGQIDARPDSGTHLAKLLAAEPDDKELAVKIYRGVLGRSPNEKELAIVLAHVEKINDRGPAFEDVLWSLINSAEFTTRR